MGAMLLKAGEVSCLRSWPTMGMSEAGAALTWLGPDDAGAEATCPVMPLLPAGARGDEEFAAFCELDDVTAWAVMANSSKVAGRIIHRRARSIKWFSDMIAPPRD